VRRLSAASEVGAKRSRTSVAHSRRAARSFAASSKKFMPMPKKKEKRGATASTLSPAPAPQRTYSRPSASVSPSSSAGGAPASCSWRHRVFGFAVCQG